jgi:hypothetical protein
MPSDGCAELRRVGAEGQVGNFPQAYTHVGLIHAAITIGELLDARWPRPRLGVTRAEVPLSRARGEPVGRPQRAPWK